MLLTTYQVTNNLDSGAGSLRAEIAAAAADPGSTVTFASNVTGQINTSGFMLGGATPVQGDFTVQGPGANQLTINANGAASIFSFAYNNNQYYNLTLEGLTLTGASSAAIIGTGAPGLRSLTLDQMEISGNAGQAISFGYGQQLTVTNSTIADNQTGSGPAIYLIAPGATTFANDTISWNQSTGLTGALSVSYGSVTLNDVTIANNQADTNNTTGASTATGGIHADAYATITLNNSIVADNLAGATSHVVDADVSRLTATSQYAPYGTLSGSYDLIGYDPDLTNGINSGVNGNQVGGENGAAAIDPKLAPLNYYGGTTRAQALLDNSPAIDAGPSTSSLATDQRGSGFSRIVGQYVDLGAVERNKPVFQVDNLSDFATGDYSPGNETLRKALELAAFTTEPVVITFAPNLEGQIVLSDSLPVNLYAAYPSDITIVGPGADKLAINADGGDSVFDFATNSRWSYGLTIEGLTLTGVNGQAVINRNEPGLDNFTLDGVEISNNQAAAIDWSGGGGEITITNSTLADNETGSLPVFDLTLVGAVLTNDTISENHSTGSVAGLSISYANATLQNVTIADNRADINTAGIGAGINVGPSDVTLQDTIVAGNTAGPSSTPADTSVSPGGSGFDQASSHNLIGADSSGTFPTGNNNKVGNPASPINAMLATLGDYGGTTQTQALLDGSPAIDAGDSSTTLSTDQRGFPRLIGSAVDIGAVEDNQTYLQVDNLGDTDDGNYGPGQLTLRESLNIAAASPTDDTILFAPGLAGEIDTTGFALGRYTNPFLGDVTIVGPGFDPSTGDNLITINAVGGASSVFTFNYNNGYYFAFTLSGLTLSGASGYAISQVAAPCVNAMALDSVAITQNGGGIVFNADGNYPLTISNSSVFDNNGTAILAQYGAEVSITNCAIADNQMGNAPALNFANGVTATLVNDNISGNQSNGPVGALSVSYGSAMLNDVLITGNQADTNNTSGNSTATAGVYAGSAGTVTLQDCEVENNSAGSGSNTVLADLGNATGSSPGTIIFLDDNQLDVDGSPAIRYADGQVNHSPTLNPVDDQEGMVGTTMSFQVTASDPDPGQTLTYSLYGDVPAGASISPSGLFTWTPTSDQADTSYSMGVQVSDNGPTPLSDSELVNLWADPIAVPTALMATYTSESDIGVKWQTVQDATSYILQRKAADGGDWQTLNLNDYDTYFGTFSDSGLQDGTTYQYRVASESGTEIGDYSEPVTVTTEMLACPLATGWLGSSSVQLTWSYGYDVPLPESLLGFYIERYTSSAEGWERIATVGSQTHSYFDNTVSSGQIYLYRVRAYTADAVATAVGSPNNAGITSSPNYGLQNAIALDITGADDLGLGLDGTISVNDNYDEQNHDAQGNLVPDNQPDYTAGDRIVQYPQLDQQLVFANLDIFPNDLGTNPHFSLTFSDNIEIWTANNYGGGTYVQVQSGVAYNESYGSLGAEMIYNGFYIEGISPGEADVTATYSDTTGTASYTAKLAVVGVNSLTLTEDNFQSNAVTTSDQLTQPNLDVLEDNNKQAVVDLQYNAPTLPTGTQVLWTAYGEGNDSAMSGAFTGNTASITLTQPKGGSRYFIGVGPDLNGDGILEPNEIDRQANVFLIPQLQVQYTAFIPWQYIVDPAVVVNPFPVPPEFVDIFKGDNRLDASGHALFNVNSTDYRIRESLTVIPIQAHSANGIQDISIKPGESAVYNYLNSVDANRNLLPNATPLATATAVINNVNNTVTITSQRIDPLTVQVQIDSGVSNPLVPGSPPIQFHATLTINYDNPDNPTYTLIGSLTPFPATELYINNQLIVAEDPSRTGTSPLGLLRTIPITKRGTLHP
jgi:hypothetical protein